MILKSICCFFLCVLCVLCGDIYLMYYILVYDIGEKRVQKVHKLLKRYLNWVQNSVFEGELTEGKFESLKIDLEKRMEHDEDSVIVYKLGSLKYTEREIIGVEKNLTDNLL